MRAIGYVVLAVAAIMLIGWSNPQPQGQPTPAKAILTGEQLDESIEPFLVGEPEFHFVAAPIGEIKGLGDSVLESPTAKLETSVVRSSYRSATSRLLTIRSSNRSTSSSRMTTRWRVDCRRLSSGLVTQSPILLTWKTAKLI